MDSSKQLYWHFAASCCLVLFVILGYIAKFYETTLAIIDQPLGQLIRQTMTTAKSTFFIAITHLGDATTIALLTVIIGLLFLRKKYFAEAIWLLINTAVIAGIGNYVIKFAFARPRPDLEQLVTETHYSFPSGHAMASTLLYGSLILLSLTLIKNQTIRRLSQLLLVVLILLVGTSRVYIGVHYPTDIIGGYLLGAAWLLGTYPTFLKQRFIWRFKGKQT